MVFTSKKYKKLKDLGLVFFSQLKTFRVALVFGRAFFMGMGKERITVILKKPENEVMMSMD